MHLKTLFSRTLKQYKYKVGELFILCEKEKKSVKCIAEEQSKIQEYIAQY